ncbi:MAG TPA: hypothetical protein PK955_09660, partial [Methanoregulaceae archaeon]|nr:hypothetical protein [Methanoregulaceae archaeon]
MTIPDVIEIPRHKQIIIIANELNRFILSSSPALMMETISSSFIYAPSPDFDGKKNYSLYQQEKQE